MNHDVIMKVFEETKTTFKADNRDVDVIVRRQLKNSGFFKAIKMAFAR